MLKNKFLVFLLILFLFCIGTGSYLTYEGYTLLLPSLIIAIPLTIALIISLVFLFLKKYKKVSIRIISSILLIYSCMVILIFFTWDIRRFALVEVTEKSETLISAIKSYNKEVGKAPSSLDELIPTYITKIPLTGMMRYPEYQYNVSDDRWSLVIDTSLGVLNWDLFVYFSDQDYPEWMAGGSVERIKNWAYVHE